MREAARRRPLLIELVSAARGCRPMPPAPQARVVPQSGSARPSQASAISSTALRACRRGGQPAPARDDPYVAGSCLFPPITLGMLTMHPGWMRTAMGGPELLRRHFRAGKMLLVHWRWLIPLTQVRLYIVAMPV